MKLWLLGSLRLLAARALILIINIDGLIWTLNLLLSANLVYLWDRSSETTKSVLISSIEVILTLEGIFFFEAY